MIVDTSALFALLMSEPDADLYAAALGGASVVRMSAGTFLEFFIVVKGKGGNSALARFDAFIASLQCTVEPVTHSQALAATDAYRKYGRGSGSPAQLNFGDCFAYALAIETGEPLLFKGQDFALTDVTPALKAAP